MLVFGSYILTMYNCSFFFYSDTFLLIRRFKSKYMYVFQLKIVRHNKFAKAQENLEQQRLQIIKHVL